MFVQVRILLLMLISLLDKVGVSKSRSEGNIAKRKANARQPISKTASKLSRTCSKFSFLFTFHLPLFADMLCFFLYKFININTQTLCYTFMLLFCFKKKLWMVVYMMYTTDYFNSLYSSFYTWQAIIQMLGIIAKWLKHGVLRMVMIHYQISLIYWQIVLLLWILLTVTVQRIWSIMTLMRR